MNLGYQLQYLKKIKLPLKTNIVILLDYNVTLTCNTIYEIGSIVKQLKALVIISQKKETISFSRISPFLSIC